MLRNAAGQLTARAARRVHLTGTIQGVGFRPFVYRLARRNSLSGWVRNEAHGVVIHIEGTSEALDTFLEAVAAEAPPAAHIATIEVSDAKAAGASGFRILGSLTTTRPTVHISPDLPVCNDCLKELHDPRDLRCGYPYINCTNCGPRYSIIRELPYDRGHTTMAGWKMCVNCASDYSNPADRRFHAQPVACPECGPAYRLCGSEGEVIAEGSSAVRETSRHLRDGSIVALKGIGGYHLVCDAMKADVVESLRTRKFRKEKPFALMVSDLAAAEELVELTEGSRAMLTSSERPIVLARGRRPLPGIAPGTGELGIMLPYTPLHVLLFDAGAPAVLVMTSANRSSEPIAYEEADAFDRLRGIADVFLVGERPIARRVDDSVVREGRFGPMILRRSRGFAPGAVARLPDSREVLAVGADLKNTITLVVAGEAFVSQHIGDLDQYASFAAFRETIDDLLQMYDIDRAGLLVAHDMHPEYASTAVAGEIGDDRFAVQHHEAHVASVLAERSEFDKPVLGIALDGTGFGRDGAIWGGEFFAGSVRGGFDRVDHLRETRLPGGDASARYPVQAAAGFLADLNELPDVLREPFHFSERYTAARQLLEKGIRVFRTTSMGRLFDAAAALCGFTRAISYEGQAAIWLEQKARQSASSRRYPFHDLDFRPLLQAVIADRTSGRGICDIARGFHLGLASGIARRAVELCEEHGLEAIVLSGGVLQNQLLCDEIETEIDKVRAVWMNRAVPCNDGGISLGQAALASAQ